MLTDAAIKALKLKEKLYKIVDRDGMYVVVQPWGAIVFRLDYRLNGRRETLTLGRYGPAGLSLARARENATAIHFFCLQDRLRGDRFARHWHDVARLDEARLAEAAFADRELANAVARHKSMFFAEKAADRMPIDYGAAVNGGLQLVPVGDGAKALEEDYAHMVEDGLLFDDAEPFDALMARCEDIAVRANDTAA
jgi:hypothetical protein